VNLSTEVLPQEENNMKRGLICLLSVGLLIGLLVAAAPSLTVYAANPAQNGVVLENLLKREQIIINDQQARLNLSNQASSAAQTWLNDLNTEGKDISTLQTALTNFQNGVSSAQASLNTAQGLLNAHTGFDGGGQVTNAAQALKTVVDAGRAERQFHLTITPASLDFRQAVRQYIQSH
jgi:hypothetical protein